MRSRFRTFSHINLLSTIRSTFELVINSTVWQSTNSCAHSIENLFFCLTLYEVVLCCLGVYVKSNIEMYLGYFSVQIFGRLQQSASLWICDFEGKCKNRFCICFLCWNWWNWYCVDSFYTPHATASDFWIFDSRALTLKCLQSAAMCLALYCFFSIFWVDDTRWDSIEGTWIVSACLAADN